MSKKIVFILLFLVCIYSLYAQAAFSPGISGYIGGTFFHPTSKYLKTIQGKESPFFRSSLSLGLDAEIPYFKINDRFEIGAAYSLMWNSKSLKAGINVLQAYIGNGLCLIEKINFHHIGITFKERLLFCKYKPFNYKFDILEFEVSPSLLFYNSKGFEINFITPVIFSYKNDGVAVRLHIGFDLKYNIEFNKGNKQ